MISRDRKQIRQAIVEQAAARDAREDRVGQAAAQQYTGSLAPGGLIFGAKVTGLYNQAGDAYTDFVTDGYVAFLKCVTWNIKDDTFGTADLWIACRKGGHFGLLSCADDWKYGVAVDDCIGYVRAGFHIEVPGVTPTAYFDGVFDPMAGSWISARGGAVPANAGETDGSFLAQIIDTTETPAVYQFHRLGSIAISGEARELGGNRNVLATDTGWHGVIVRVFPSPDSASSSTPSWVFTYPDGGFWGTITAETSPGVYTVTSQVSGETDLSATEVNGVSEIAANTGVRVFAIYGPHDDTAYPDEEPTYRFQFTKPDTTISLSAGNGIAVEQNGNTRTVSVVLADSNPGLEFSTGKLKLLVKPDLGLAVDASGVYGVPNNAEAIHVDGQGFGLSIDDAADTKLEFDDGKLCHKPPGAHAYYSTLGNVCDLVISYDSTGHATGFCLWNGETWEWTSPWETTRPTNPPSGSWNS